MAYTKTFLEISTLITLLMILTQQKTDAADLDPSDLLSLLTDKQHHHRKQPLIIVLGSDAPLEMNRARVGTTLSSETSGEAVHMVHHLLEHDQPKKKTLQLRMSTVKPYQQHEKKKQRFTAQRLREEERVLQKDDSNVLRSPIVKKLLRISNSLRCEAKNECQDKCNNKFHGAKEIKCQVQCEIKYACEDEGKDDDEDKDDICDDSSDSCNKHDEYGSTKGVTWAANGYNPGRCRGC